MNSTFPIDQNGFSEESNFLSTNSIGIFSVQYVLDYITSIEAPPPLILQIFPLLISFVNLRFLQFRDFFITDANTPECVTYEC